MPSGGAANADFEQTPFLGLSLAKAILGGQGPKIDFGRTIGPLRLGMPGARSDALPNIDEPSSRSRLLRGFALTCTDALLRITPMNTGTVKFYNDQKGFGFIQPDNGDKDVFVHATALERAGMRGLVEGQKVAFDTAEDRRSGKIAVNNIQTA
jgi:CspA family cold shock protein